MENSQPQSESEEEMSFEHKIFQDFSRDGPSFFHRQTFGQGRFGFVFPHYRLVILSLSLLNAVLLITAVLIGIYCAKAKDFEIPHTDAIPLIIERNFLRNHSGIIKAKVEAQMALARESTSHLQLKLEVKQKKTITDGLQREIELLHREKTNLQTNRTSLEVSCDRCPPGWSFLKSSCYRFAHHEVVEQKNWQDSRADCVRQGGDLLVINNLEEQQLISENVPRQSSSNIWWEKGYWIGLTDVVSEGTWVWINNVTEVETMYWRSGQPSHGEAQSGNCAAFYYYHDTMKTWYNVNCRHLLSSICEMEPRAT
uniref:C-type lectin domain-containing protein n=1 Tax=Amphiprion percula TaxID=161767 RepID=A0A3P8RPD4_AMPPE